MKDAFSRQRTHKLPIPKSALAVVLSWALLSSAAARPAAPPVEQVKRATEHWNRARQKVETAEKAFDKAAEEAFGSNGYAKDVIAPYRANVTRAEIETAIAESMAREAYREAARRGFDPLVSPTGMPAVNEYGLFLEIVNAKKEALDEAKALLEEKVRDFLNRIDQETKPDEPTVVEILDDALRRRELAERELQRAQEAEAVEAAERGLGAKIRTEDLPTTGMQ